MTELLDAGRLRQSSVNPFAEEACRKVPVLYWTIDERTQRPLGHWRLEVRPASVGPRHLVERPVK